MGVFNKTVLLLTFRLLQPSRRHTPRWLSTVLYNSIFFAAFWLKLIRHAIVLIGGETLFKQQGVSVEELSADGCPWNVNVLKTNICPRSEALRANMLGKNFVTIFRNTL